MNGSGAAEVLLDRTIVDSKFAEITTYLQTEDAIASMLEARVFVEAQLDEFVPDMDSLHRMTAVLIGSAALGFVCDRYGFDEYSPKVFSGLAEQEVIATFHHAGHSRSVVRDMLRYAVAVNERRPGTYTHADLARLVIIGSFHDTVMGNRRGVDERQSGMFANRYLMAIARLAAPVTEIQVATEASTWDEEALRQSFDSSKGHVKAQLAMCSGDHMPTLEPRAPYIAVTLAPEDACRNFNGRIFTRVARAAGFSLIGATIEDCLDFMDMNDELRAWYTQYLDRSAKFHATFQPADLELVDMFPTSRRENVEHITGLHRRYAAGSISAVDTLTLSRDYMQQL